VTGTSVILVDEGTDTGPIVAQRPSRSATTTTRRACTSASRSSSGELLVDVVTRMTARGWQVVERKVVLR
jgi:folate-dependent phosphoribosylglycinamide formyltransferase PurN